jgi:enamine deaminase RidA (YjgF/YER057c/UK114 family)
MSSSAHFMSLKSIWEVSMSNVIRTALASLLIASFAPLATAGPATQYYPRAGKPFSSAVRVGDFVYISGVVGTAADGTLPADFVTQATNAMNAVAKQLQLAGASMDDVYRCTIALTNMDNWDAFNAVYTKYFKPDHYPVRMSFGVSSLRGPAVEVQCEAHLGK